MWRIWTAILIALLLSCIPAAADPVSPDAPQAAPPVAAQAEAGPTIPAADPVPAPQTPPEEIEPAEAPEPSERAAAPELAEPDATLPEEVDPVEGPEPSDPAEADDLAEPVGEPPEEIDQAGTPESRDSTGVQESPDFTVPTESDEPTGETEAPTGAEAPEPITELIEITFDGVPADTRPDLTTALSFSQERAVALRYDWRPDAETWAAHPVRECVAVYATNESDRTLTDVRIRSGADRATDRGGLYHLIFDLTHPDPLTINPGETVQIGTFTFLSEGGTTSEAEQGALSIPLMAQYAD